MGFHPMGLSLLIAVAKQSGCDVSLFDTTYFDFGYVDWLVAGNNLGIYKPVDMVPYGQVKEKKDLHSEYAKRIDEFKPDAVMFTVMGDEYLIAEELTKLTDVPTLWGGPYVSVNPDGALKRGADHICIGAGVTTLRRFITGDRSRVFQINPDENQDGFPYLDWDEYSPSDSYRPYCGKVYRMIDYVISRGCPYECTYCINAHYHKLWGGRKIYRYSIDRVIEELKHLKSKYRMEFIKFHDNMFLMHPQLEELSRRFRKEVNLPFVCETHVKTVTKETARLLKEMGCVSVSMGVETGNLWLRKNVLERVETTEEIVSAFGIMNDAGIRTVSYNMLALPFETKETYKETVELNARSGVQVPYADFFYPFEGTKLRDISIQNGYFDPECGTIYKRDEPALRFKDVTVAEWVKNKYEFGNNVRNHAAI